MASPCGESWDAMEGDGRVRFCGRCRLNVYNFSEMTEAELRRLVERREGRLCGRFFRRRDGTVLTRDCPVGWRRKAAFALAAALALLALVGVALALRSASDEGDPPLPGWIQAFLDWVRGARGVELGKVCQPSKP